MTQHDTHLLSHYFLWSAVQHSSADPVPWLSSHKGWVQAVGHVCDLIWTLSWEGSPSKLKVVSRSQFIVTYWSGVVVGPRFLAGGWLRLSWIPCFLKPVMRSLMDLPFLLGNHGCDESLLICWPEASHRFCSHSGRIGWARAQTLGGGAIGDLCKIVPSHHELAWVTFRQQIELHQKHLTASRRFFLMGSLPFQWLTTSQGLSRPLSMSPVFIPIFPLCLALASDVNLCWKINSPLSSFVSTSSPEHWRKVTWDQRGLGYVATKWFWFLWAPVLGHLVMVREPLLHACSVTHSMSLSCWLPSGAITAWCSLAGYLFPCLGSASLLLSEKQGCRESCFVLFMQYLWNLAHAKHLTGMCRINNWFSQCLINVLWIFYVEVSTIAALALVVISHSDFRGAWWLCEPKPSDPSVTDFGLGDV